MPSIIEDRVRDRTVATRPTGAAPSTTPDTDSGSVRDRPRSTRGTLLLPPWTRAPLLGMRQPGAFIAVAVASAILACAAASAALFLSSAGSASLQQQIAGQCSNAAYPSIGTTSLLGDGTGPVPTATATSDRAYPAAMSEQGLAPAPVLVGEGMDGVIEGNTNNPIRPFYRAGSVDNITVLDSGPGNGVYVTRATAEYNGVGVGDSLSVGAATVPIVGVYQNLYEEAVRPFWCSYDELFLNLTNANTPPPELVIATDRASWYSLAVARDANLIANGGFGTGSLRVWESPFDPDTATLATARGLIADQDAAQAAAIRATAASRTPGERGLLAEVANDNPTDLLIRSERLQNGLRGPVIPTAVAGTILAILLVAAAGSYWADRRLREVRLLSSRGVGPGALAVKAGLELVIPAALGTVAGYYLARGLIAVAGPADDLESSAIDLAILTTVAGFLLGLLLLSIVAGLRARNSTEKPVGHKRSWLAYVPFELVLLGGAAYCWWQLRGADAVFFDGSVAQVNGLLVTFPLLFLAGTAILVVRVVIGLLPLVRRWSRRWPAAAFVAVNQLSANRVVSASLLIALCLPVATLAYSATLTASSERTVTSKALVSVGAEQAITTYRTFEASPALDGYGTVVARYQGVFTGGDEATALGIDPATFAEVAYWESSFAEQSLTDLVSALTSYSGDRVPVIAAGGIPLGPNTIDFGTRQNARPLEVEVVGVADVLPGRRSAEPLFLLDNSVFGADLPQSADLLNEIWTNDSDPTPAITAIQEQDAVLFRVFSTTEVFQLANFLGVGWTFGYLQALAAFVGVIAIGGLLLYLETRQRRRTASYAMARRMGLSRWSHFRSLLAELGSVMALAVVVGSGLAAAAIGMAYRRLDLDPIREPSPLLSIPWITLAAIVVAALVLGLLTAAYAQRRSDGANPAEVLRLGG